MGGTEEQRKLSHVYKQEKQDTWNRNNWQQGLKSQLYVEKQVVTWVEPAAKGTHILVAELGGGWVGGRLGRGRWKQMAQNKTHCIKPHGLDEACGKKPLLGAMAQIKPTSGTASRSRELATKIWSWD